MNFKKSKDVKRASYYVWFLGSKESKGLRGDEYVTPVLNYMLDNECDLEPSKVTLQVSNKGLKIIQILTVPRKSSKLSADQQTQLFANSRRLSSEPPASSLLKTEQVKHHIPHNSITWVYQEEDIICAILLLYNPITRCPVHVHAYRCDSIETADNLRLQLQALVARPENQKKFRDIESRLAAKGLLLPPQNYADEELPSHTQAPYPETYRYNSASKTLNSDGRSTRTEGSDENSEKSNSSDLGYAVRSKSNQTASGYGKHIPPPPPIMMGNQKTSKSSSDQFKSKSKPPKGKHKQSALDEPEVSKGVTAALYDSLAAELRAKLGNPKMGPILLPPRDYESQSGAVAQANKSRSKHQLYPLTRSESSGKSSSGIGSDEALSSEAQNKLMCYREPRYREMHEPQSYIDRHQRPKEFIYPDSDKPLYSLQMRYSSDEEDYDSNDVLEVDVEDIEEDVIFTANSNRKSKSTFDLSPKYKSSAYQRPIRSSNAPVEPKYHQAEQYVPPEIDPYSERNSHLSKIYASNPNLSRAPLKEAKLQNDKLAFVIGRREQRSLQQGHHGSPLSGIPQSSSNGRQAKAPQKFYFADAEFADLKSRMASPEKSSKYYNQRYLGRSSGNLAANCDYSNSGPTSLGYHQTNMFTERSISPQFFYSQSQERRDVAPKQKPQQQQQQHFVPSKSNSNLSRGASTRFGYDHELAMRKKLEQPYSRYSYIEADHHNRESRFNYAPPVRR